MNEINSNHYNFSSLPEELNVKILSNLDRNTQYRVSSTCKALYQGLNKIAESALQDKWITKLDKGEGASKQLADHYRLYCKVLHSVYPFFKFNKEIFDNVAFLDKLAEADLRQAISKAARNTIYLLAPRYCELKSAADPSMDSELQILMEAGGELPKESEMGYPFGYDALNTCLQAGCSEKTIKMILNKQPFAKEVHYYCLSSAIRNKYSERILLSLIDKVKKKEIKDIGFSIHVFTTINAALTNKLPDSILLKLIEKADGKIVVSDLTRWKRNDSCSEPVLMALLDILDINNKYDSKIMELAQKLTLAPLNKLIEICQQKKSTFYQSS